MSGATVGPPSAARPVSPTPPGPPDGEEKNNGAKQEHSGEPSKEQLRDGFRQMRRLSWITLGYQLFASALLGLVMGGSQAVKTEWLENMLALVPPIAVLLTYQTENRPPDDRRPFGYHRAGTVAFLVAAFALAAIGLFLFFDNGLTLLRRERPSIGGYTLFGRTFWHGWLMIAAMVVTAIPPVILGRMKSKVAELLHDKPLHADAEMNRANWLTNGGGVVGLLLVAAGFWWGDALAAWLISFDILRDGVTNVRRSLSDVMDYRPSYIEKDEEEPIVGRVNEAVGGLPFVADHRVLLREHGRYFFAEIFIKPFGDETPPATEATRRVREAVLPLDWRLQHVAVEITDDLKSADVLTREELDIEAQDGDGAGG